MDGDRILLIPAVWAPDPSVFEKWPALRALMQRLRAFLPVDILLWPSLKGQAREDSAVKSHEQAIRRQVRAVHHVLDCPASLNTCYGQIQRYAPLLPPVSFRRKPSHGRPTILS